MRPLSHCWTEVTSCNRVFLNFICLCVSIYVSRLMTFLLLFPAFISSFNFLKRNDSSPLGSGLGFGDIILHCHSNID